MAEARVCTLLGFARKAGHLVAGDSNVHAALEKGQGHLLVVAADISEKNQQRWRKRGADKGLATLTCCDKATLGTAIGLSPRGIICILDERMAKAIEDAMEE